MIIIAVLAPCAVAADLLPWLLAVMLGPLFLFKVAMHLGTILDPNSPGALPRPVPRASLPVYTVLVPLRGEAAVVERLVQALAGLDYPRDRLQILFLTEADDPATGSALRGIDLPDHMAVLQVPPGHPRTKPRALNAGLAAARGSLVTIYDAEDRPEPDQLLVSAALFQTLPPQVMCLQARLAIDNQQDSLISRLFAIEYAGLFDVTKPGLARNALPVPLGGTSNHFRSDHLRALGGWDSYNVTEDADLGFRIARAGWLVADLPSTTEEEAPGSLGIWMKQRRRWLKGWLQTTIAHGHAPFAMLSHVGLVTAAAIAALSLGQVLSILLGPFLALAGLLWLLSPDTWMDDGVAELVLKAMALVVFGTGVVVHLGAPLLGLARRKQWHLMPYLPLLPIYALLITFAGWWAMLDYLRSPFAWHKTPHGLSRTSRRVASG